MVLKVWSESQGVFLYITRLATRFADKLVEQIRIPSDFDIDKNRSNADNLMEALRCLRRGAKRVSMKTCLVYAEVIGTSPVAGFRKAQPSTTATATHSAAQG